MMRYSFACIKITRKKRKRKRDEEKKKREKYKKKREKPDYTRC